MNNIEIFAVCGRPILHSKSPDIFRMIFDKFNYPAYYTRIASDNTKEILSIADELNISGLNVTAPFKAEMYKLMDECDKNSREIKAVNTIFFRDKKKIGFNTDSTGVVETLKHNGINPNNRNCLIIGYGNAAKAAVYAIKNEWKNSNIYITGRNEEKAEELAKWFDSYNIIPLNPHFDRLRAGSLEKSENNTHFLIISTIPKNAYFDIKLYLKSCEYFMDAAYPNSLMTEEAKRYKCKIIPGEEWLVNQALASLEIFTGKEILRYTQNDMKEEILRNAQNDSKENIYLTGFSGSGKTSIGKMLAQKIGYLFFDTDSLIQERENKTINDIFNLKGEDYFRKVENEILERLCGINNAVISCGGGTLLNDTSVDIAKKSGYIVWLYTSLKDCFKRINKDDKPMLFSKSDEEIGKLYNDRKFLYCKSADLLVGNSGDATETIDNIVYEIKMISNN